MTAAISAGQRSSRQASASACMLLPRPEIRMTRRRLIEEVSGKMNNSKGKRTVPTPKTRRAGGIRTNP
ncbi:hypothetical protein D3C75_1234580 [compost metagenome]